MMVSLAKATASHSALDLGDRSRIARLWRGYIRPFRGTLYLAFFVMAIAGAIQAGFVYLVKYVIDVSKDMSVQPDAAEAAITAAKTLVPVIVLIAVAAGLTLYIKNVLSNKVALGTVAGLQDDMFAATHNADFARFGREPTGNIVAHFVNDVNVVAAALLRSMNNLVMDLVTIIATLGLMFYLDWLLTIVVLVVYPLAIWPVIAISKKMRGNAKDAQEHIGTLTSQLTESFSGARLVKTYGLQDTETRRLGHAFQTRMKLYLDLVKNQSKVEPILTGVGGFAIAGVFVLGIYQVTRGASTAGDIAAVLTALLVLAPRLRALGSLNNVVQDGLSALKRIFGIIDEVPTLISAPDAKPLIVSHGEVSFDAVSFSYPDGTQALSDVSFDAKPGQTIALVGASGGGKSTLLNLIPRLYDVSNGAITIDGQDIRHVQIETLRDNLALVSQDSTLFDDTIAANIGFGKLGASRDDIIAAAKAAAAHDFITALPNGYDNGAGENGSALSGGQRQRIALARAILRDAPILLLDEATSALDAESETLVQSALSTLTKGRTTFVIAHRLSTVTAADQIFVIDNGQIIERGTHKSLSKAGGTYARLHALQLT